MHMNINQVCEINVILMVIIGQKYFKYYKNKKRRDFQIINRAKILELYNKLYEYTSN